MNNLPTPDRMSSHRFTRCAFLGFAVSVILSGCAARSGAGVPALNPGALHSPRFDGLAPRTLALEVLDERTPLPETSGEMVREVTRALGERFRSAGFRVDAAGAKNKLTLTVTYKDSPMAGYQREDCIWFKGRLTTASGTWVESEGGACFEWRNLYGMHLGGDASRAYETGLSGVVEQLDRGWTKVAGRSPGMTL